MRKWLKGSMGTGAVSAVLSAPVLAGVVAIVWQFPIVMVGTEGRSLGAMFGAIISMGIFMTLFSFFGGALLVAFLGAVAGYCVNRGPRKAQLLAGAVVGAIAAVAVAAFDALFV